MCIRDSVYSAFISVIDAQGLTEGSPADGFDVTGWSVFTLASSSAGFPWALTKLAALGAALTLVLGVVAVGLGLAAVESRDERSVLHVVGAPPASLRRLAAAKTWILTTLAAVVAVPTGFAVVWVVRAVAKSEFDRHAPLPVFMLISLLIVVPAVAMAITWAGSGLAQRVRPVTASSMRLD